MTVGVCVPERASSCVYTTVHMWKFVHLYHHICVHFPNQDLCKPVLEDYIIIADLHFLIIQYIQAIDKINLWV